MLAEFERDIIAERTTTAMQHKRGLGEYTGGLVPYAGRVQHDDVIEQLPAAGPDPALRDPVQGLWKLVRTGLTPMCRRAWQTAVQNIASRALWP